MSSAMSSSHDSVSRSISMVREALVGSVTCRPPSTPPVMFQSTRCPCCRTRRSPASAFSRAPSTLSRIQLDLRTGEVGGQRQADLGLVPVGAAAEVTELVADLVGAGVLPDDRVVDRLAGGPVPDQRGLALVGDADRGDVLGAEVGLGQRAADDLAGVVPDLLGVVLDPAGPREDLLVLLLVGPTTRPAWLKIMHRVDVVPWSIAATYCSLIWFLLIGGVGIVAERCRVAARHEAAALTASIR